MGLFPPDLRISTACIEEAQRAVIGSLDSDDSEESQWKPVHSGGLKEMVAEGVCAGVEGLEEEILVLASHKPDTTPLKSDTTTQTHDAVIAVHDSGSQVTEVPASQDPQPKLQQEAVHAIQPSALLVKETNVPRMQAFELPETSDILKLIKSLSTSKQPLRAHWMHFIDSGGSPNSWKYCLPLFATYPCYCSWSNSPKSFLTLPQWSTSVLMASLTSLVSFPSQMSNYYSRLPSCHCSTNHKYLSHTMLLKKSNHSLT